MSLSLLALKHYIRSNWHLNTVFYIDEVRALAVLSGSFILLCSVLLSCLE